MARLRATRQEHLVGLPALLLMLLVILAVFYFLFPRRPVYELPQYAGKPDPLSIAYLRAVLRGKPGDHYLRLMLARQLLDLGQYEEAARVLEPVPDDNPALSPRKALMMAEIRLLRAWASRDQAARQRARDALWEGLLRISTEHFERADLKRLISLALQLGDPALAARISRRLASEDSARAAYWWGQAGRWSLAAGDPRAASRDYFRAAQASSDDAAARKLALKSIEAALAANRPGEAHSLARYFLHRWPDDEALLRMGVRTALATGHPRDARHWNARYLERHPNDPDALRKGRAIALALGDLDAARRLARRIVRLPGHRMEDQEQLARILEWSGDADEALVQWKRLVRQRPLLRYREEVLRLSRMLMDLPAERAALRALARQRPLSRDEHLRLAQVEELLGEPEAADRVLAEWLRRHPADRPVWQQRYRIALRAEDEARARQILDRMQKRFGIDDALRRMRARALWRFLREEQAWQVLQQLEHPLEAAEEYDLEIQAELAWRHDARELALALYRRLFERYRDRHIGPAEVDDGTAERVRLIHERLILLAGKRGEAETVAEAGLHGWQQLHDQALLTLAMQQLVRSRQWKRLDALLQVAMRNRLPGDRIAPVLLQLAEGEASRHRVDAAERLYRKVLALQPGSAGARLGLLWLWIDAQRRTPLRQALVEWAPLADDDARYWGAFAAGWETVGEPRRALAWYARRLRENPRDALWWLNLADALDATGRRADAWRARRRGLALALPALQGRLSAVDRLSALDRRSLIALSKVNGQAAIQPLADRAAARDQVALAWIVGWDLASGEDERLRAWLLRKQRARLDLPAWQQINLALAENDLSRLQRLLEGEGLSPLDRVQGMERQGQSARALARALPLVRTDASRDERLAATQWSADLYRRLPTSADLSRGTNRIGGLQIVDTRLGARISRRNLSFRLRVSQDLLDMTDGRYDLDGRARERRLLAGLEWHGLRDRLEWDMGSAQREDRSLPYLRLGWQHRWSANSELYLWLEDNGRSDATGILRADAVVDRLHLEWNWNLTARTSLMLDVERNRADARGGGRISRGSVLEFALADRQMLGTNELQFRLQGAWLRNTLADAVPGDMQPRLRPGSTVADIVPERYAALGVGLALARGQPMARAPVVGGLRYRIDLWGGWVWPEGRPSFSGEAAIGSRVLGSDELALSLFRSETLNLVGGEANQGVRLQYRYFFGR